MKLQYIAVIFIIIIVPISKKRQKERGYNQSELFAREISNIINAQIIKNILHKMKETPPQSTLNKKQREENVKNVYKVGKIQKIMDKRILLVDDIYTTGNMCKNFGTSRYRQKANRSINDSKGLGFNI